MISNTTCKHNRSKKSLFAKLPCKHTFTFTFTCAKCERAYREGTDSPPFITGTRAGEVIRIRSVLVDAGVGEAALAEVGVTVASASCMIRAFFEGVTVTLAAAA